jgi:hypothetical protein
MLVAAAGINIVDTMSFTCPEKQGALIRKRNRDKTPRNSISPYRYVFNTGTRAAGERLCQTVERQGLPASRAPRAIKRGLYAFACLAEPLTRGPLQCGTGFELNKSRHRIRVRAPVHEFRRSAHQHHCFLISTICS